MRVVFFGTPEPAARALEELLASRHEVAAVVTQPDRPKGRSGAPQPSPVKELATKAGVPVLQPMSPKDDGFAEALAAHGPEACAVVAYGHILPSAILAMPPKGTVNVHFSLLPRYRGAAPVQRALMAGETETGVSVFLLEPTIDTGPVVARAVEPIRPDDTTGTLLERLAEVGARLLVETLDRLAAGTFTALEQDDSLATPAPKIKADEGAIDWSRPSGELANLVRALNPAPGAYANFRGKRLKIWRATPLRPTDLGAPDTAVMSAMSAHPGTAMVVLPPQRKEPGSVVTLGKDRLAVTSGDGALELLEVQLEGSKRLDAADFVRGHRISDEERLESG